MTSIEMIDNDEYDTFLPTLRDNIDILNDKIKNLSTPEVTRLITDYCITIAEELEMKAIQEKEESDE